MHFPLEFAMVTMILPQEARVPQVHIPQGILPCSAMKIYRDSEHPQEIVAVASNIRIPRFEHLESFSLIRFSDEKLRSLLLKTQDGVVAVGLPDTPMTARVPIVKLATSCKPSQLESSSSSKERSLYRSMKALEKALGVEARMWITKWTLPSNSAIAAWPIYPVLPEGATQNKYSDRGVRAFGEGATGDSVMDRLMAPSLARGIGPAPYPSKIPSNVPLHPRATKPVRPNSHKLGYYTAFLEADDISSSNHPGPFFALPGDEITTLIQCRAIKQPEVAHPLELGSGEMVASIEFNTGTGGIRMLTSTGWRFAVLTEAQLDATGYFANTAPVLENFDESKIAAEWRWKDGRKLWKLRKGKVEEDVQEKKKDEGGDEDEPEITWGDLGRDTCLPM